MPNGSLSEPPQNAWCSLRVFRRILKLSTGVYRDGSAHLGRPVHQLGTSTGRELRKDCLDFSAKTQRRQVAEEKRAVELSNSTLLMWHSLASLRLGGLAFLRSLEIRIFLSERGLSSSGATDQSAFANHF